MRDSILAVPGDGAGEAVSQLGAGFEAEELAGTRHVELAARLAVRHRRVPGDLAAETGQLGDQRGQVADRDLAARAEVDRLGAVIALRGEDQPVGSVLDVE